MTDVWQALSALPPAIWLQRNAVAYLLVNAAHIVSLGLLIGTIITLDLRLLGAFRAVPVSALWPLLSRLAACGLGLAALTGAWLFSVNAPVYVENTAFQAKLGLIAAAVLNALWLHRRQSGSEMHLRSQRAATRFQAALSLCLWLSAVVAGRWIGFL
ncbi:hypothetical protein SAMN05216421_0886 [Halopseudomonas xinjiangensis]|uniref:DUF6644 domain-containing protein n=1 Tax=Halopseudomonas xinjiangensis TaxID=487184 RepID=A0A1H1PCS2_9GAMM|nr:DUF6644 family protein [Halopseudomonas xinjiangensis]SDS08914.1 hypothetical protein SAMN05216421_0886 [Halopseudomonas xinjiangensis]